MGYGFYSGGVHYGIPTRPTAAKVAATPSVYDIPIKNNLILTNISIYDGDELLNSTQVTIVVQNAQGRVTFDLPFGACGGDTVYNWSGKLEIRENSVLRITLDGPTATTPRIRLRAATFQEAKT